MERVILLTQWHECLVPDFLHIQIYLRSNLLPLRHFICANTLIDQQYLLCSLMVIVALFRLTFFHCPMYMLIHVQAMNYCWIILHVACQVFIGLIAMGCMS
jgi:hypothetical protein